MNLEEKTVKQEVIYKGRILNVRADDVLLPDGRPAGREVVEHSGGVAVLPLDRDGNVVMVRQWRYPFMEALLEIPAGKLSPDEKPYDCGLRELEEEVGLVPSDYLPMGCIYPSPGYSAERIYLYLARDFKSVPRHPDQDEFLKVEKYSFEQLQRMILLDEIRDAKTIAAVLRAKLMLGW